MLASILSFTSDSLSAVLTYPAQIFDDLSLLIMLIVGLPLGFWVIRKVVALVRAR